MATQFTQLPNDVFAIILKYKDISIEDIVSLKSTCKRLQQVKFSSKFWEEKYYQRFRYLEKKHKTEKLKKIFNSLETGLKYIKEIQRYVSMMSHNNLWRNREIELYCLLRCTVQDTPIYCFIMDDLFRITFSSRHNLTIKYNCELIYQWLRQYRLVYQQTKFMNKPEKKLLLERQFIVVADIFQPSVSYSAISTWLDEIAEEVKSRLKNNNFEHSIFSTSSKKFFFCKNNNINDNFWSAAEARQIKCILEEIIFSQLSVDKLRQFLIIMGLDTPCFNYFPEYFRRYLLTIIYHCVARRLGIRCVLHYMRQGDKIIPKILWSEKYDIDAIHEVEYFYIHQDSKLLYPSNIVRGKCQIFLSPRHDIKINNILISPIIYDLARLYVHIDHDGYHCNIFYNWKLYNLSQVFYRCKRDCIDIRLEHKYITMAIKDRYNIVRKIQPEIRNEKIIKFAVGMIVRHSRKSYLSMIGQHYSHIGVIIGWHYNCKVTFIHDTLNTLVPDLSECCKIQHICICRCQTWKKNILEITLQPHYIILAEDNILCYVPQDTLSLCGPRWIDNVEIGRYFYKFKRTHYIPNKRLAEEYPKDITAIRKILLNQRVNKI